MALSAGLKFYTPEEYFIQTLHPFHVLDNGLGDGLELGETA